MKSLVQSQTVRGESRKQPRFPKGGSSAFLQGPLTVGQWEARILCQVRNIGTPTIVKHAWIADRGWDGWMASSTQQTWIWASSGSGWRTGKPGVLQCVGSLRVRQNWVTELTELREKTVEEIGGCLKLENKVTLRKNVIQKRRVSKKPNE